MKWKNMAEGEKRNGENNEWKHDSKTTQRQDINMNRESSNELSNVNMRRKT